MKHFLFLALAIICETVATSVLKKTEQFTKLLPSVIFIAMMGAAFYFLSLALKGIPIGIAYAIWSAVGIVLISIIAYFAYQQTLDWPAIIGIGFIVLGVVIINLFSKSATH